MLLHTKRIDYCEACHRFFVPPYQPRAYQRAEPLATHPEGQPFHTRNLGVAGGGRAEAHSQTLRHALQQPPRLARASTCRQTPLR